MKITVTYEDPSAIHPPDIFDCDDYDFTWGETTCILRLYKQPLGHQQYMMAAINFNTILKIEIDIGDE